MEKPTTETKPAPKKVEGDVEYTGEGFMDYSELIKIIENYQQRHKLCEDVDYMEQLSGEFKL